jgi:hypothetical protein
MYSDGMSKITSDKTREGYEVGAKPPELSEEAESRLRKLKVSPKLRALVEKARKAKVTRGNAFSVQDPTTLETAAKGDAV